MERKPQEGDIYRVIEYNAGVSASRHLLRAVRLTEYEVHGHYLSPHDDEYGNVYEGSGNGTIYVSLEAVEWI